MKSFCAASFRNKGSYLRCRLRKTFGIVVLNLLFDLQIPISFLVEVQIPIWQINPNDNRPFLSD